ncbi:hypothetical protein M885DRAFT_501976 [Pelagophyceae sp. CCMP2097]|nr:hypothetical protein M885DRAFT_501976 [Pelagophyceae sp. CCMP2097]
MKSLLCCALAVYAFWTAHDCAAAAANRRTALAKRRGVRSALEARSMASLHQRPKVVVVLPTFRRARALERTLGALAKSLDRDQFVFVTSRDDASHIGVARALRNFRGGIAASAALRHRRDLLSKLWPNVAIGRHVRYLLEFGLMHARADAVVVVEDDVEMSTDALAYFEWVIRDVERNFADVLAVSAFNATGAAHAEQPAELERLYLAAFNSWGWAVSRPKYRTYLRRAWPRGASWDLDVSRYVQQALDLSVLSPGISRARVHPHDACEGPGSCAASANFDGAGAGVWGAVRLASDGAADAVLRATIRGRSPAVVGWCWEADACTGPGDESTAPGLVAASTCKFVEPRGRWLHEALFGIEVAALARLALAGLALPKRRRPSALWLRAATLCVVAADVALLWAETRGGRKRWQALRR